ncbi:hypothetical protein HY604_04280 [Candidatus Peregrinibacteria bacterium]|nr:hypothetical protein [Candidatus Peregrinibacteria bacterium]
MIIINQPLQIKEIRENHANFFDTMVKIVVDTEKAWIALDAELHSDLEELLLENESEQENLWGANIYFTNPHDIEFTSLINIRPGHGNKGMLIENPETKKRITEIVKKLILP